MKVLQRDYFHSHEEPSPHRAARYDAITGLLNYTSFQSEAASLLQSSTGVSYMVMYADILNFKALNQSCGFEEGDRQLTAVANFLQERNSCVMAARIFSDLFLVLFTYEQRDELTGFCNSFTLDLESFVAAQQSFHPGCQIELICGLCPVTGGADGLVQAIDNANAARKMAKRGYLSRCLLYNAEMEISLRREFQLTAAIKTALLERQFTFCLQPKVNLYTGKVVGAEALVRWPRETGVTSMPDEFIPFMERDGSIVELDFQIYEAVFRYLYEQQSLGAPVVPISLNVSRLHLRDKFFVSDVHSMALRYGIHPSLLEFELTESIFVDSLEEAVTAIQALRDYGYKVSVDDFGSGYSSLNLLKDLEFDVLKLDKSFIAHLGSSNHKNAIVISSIIQMAKKLHMSVLCEGISTLEQLEFIKWLGCDMAQGYYFLRPVEPSAFEQVLLDGGYCPLPWISGAPVPDNAAAEYKDIGQMLPHEEGAISHSLFEILPGGMCGTELHSGKVLFLSEGMCSLTGYSRQEMLSDAQLSRALFGGSSETQEQLGRQLKDTGSIHAEYPIRRKNGSEAFIRMYGGLTNSPTWGQYLLCMFFDITAERESARMARQAQRDFNTLIASMDGGLARLVLNDGCRLEMASAGYYAMTGYTREELAAPPFNGRAEGLVLQEDLPVLNRDIQLLISNSGITRTQYRIRRKDGRVVWNTAYVCNLFQEGERILADIIFVDSTKEKSCEQLEQGGDAGPQSALVSAVYRSRLCGVVQYEVLEEGLRLLSANRAAYLFCGMEPGTPDLSRSFIEAGRHIHPDCRDQVLAQLRGLTREGDTTSYEAKFLRRDGGFTWVRGDAVLCVDMQGRRIIHNILLDCTHGKELEHKFSELYQRLAYITDQMLFEYDIVEDHITFANKLPPFSFLPDSIEQFKSRFEKGEFGNSIRNLMELELSGADVHRNLERPYLTPDGQAGWVRVSLMQVRDETGRAISCIGSIAEVTAEVGERQRLQRLSETDPLTDLYNKRAAEVLCRNYLSNEGREQPCALFVLDVDNFKMANDTMGHSYGDRVLRLFADRISSIFRGGDVVARIGGDEFLVLMKNAGNLHAVQNKANDICQNAHQVSRELNSADVSCSIGVALAEPGAETWDELFSRADAALYRAKELGKNQYHISPGR